MPEDGRSSHQVVVGSSAGGAQARSEMVSTLPGDLPVSIVVAQHLDPDRESNVEGIHSRRCPLPARFDVRIFATDVDEDAIAFARSGVNPRSALGDLSEEQIGRYFVREGDQYQVRKSVRSTIVFGEHDLARRSPLRRRLGQAPRRDPAGHERGGAGRERRRHGVVQRIDVFRRTFGDGKPGGPEAFDKLGGTVLLDENGEEFPPGQVFEMRVVAGKGATRRMFEAGGRPVERAPEAAADKLEQAGEEAKSALSATRDLSMMLRHTEIGGELGKALSDLLETTVPPNVRYEVGVKGDEAAVPPHVGSQLFLILREAVRNAVTHAGCGRVTVGLVVSPEGVAGAVEDDGLGFGAGNGEVGGVGMRAMKERAALLGGALRVSPRPDAGTKVEVSVPLAQEDVR